MSSSLSASNQQYLLRLARAAIETAARGRPVPPVDPAGLPPDLLRPAATFVTLTIDGELRGCIGGLQAISPLVEDVQLHAAQAAQHDPRFWPVTPEEVPLLEVEISILSAPQPLVYARPEELPRRLRPGVDGVILAHGLQRATFLPQVWEHLPDPEDFLSRLCEKMGTPPDTWRRVMLEVQTYQVDEFKEADFRPAAA